MNKLTILLFSISIAAVSACSSAPSDSNANAASNMAVLDNANLPEGLSTQPIQPSGNSTPGIPDPRNVNANVAVKAPGIDPKNAVRTLRPGEKIPGIDPEAARRQMRQNANISAPPPPPANGSKPDAPPAVKKQ